MKNLIAAVIVTLTASTAQAGNTDVERVIAGVILGAVIADVFGNTDTKPHTHQHHTRTHQHHTRTHQHTEPCYVDVQYQGSWTIRTVTACDGRVLREERWRR